MHDLDCNSSRLLHWEIHRRRFRQPYIFRQGWNKGRRLYWKLAARRPIGESLQCSPTRVQNRLRRWVFDNWPEFGRHSNSERYWQRNPVLKTQTKMHFWCRNSRHATGNFSLFLIVYLFFSSHKFFIKNYLHKNKIDIFVPFGVNYIPSRHFCKISYRGLPFKHGMKFLRCAIWGAF